MLLHDKELAELIGGIGELRDVVIHYAGIFICRGLRVGHALLQCGNAAVIVINGVISAMISHLSRHLRRRLGQLICLHEVKLELCPRLFGGVKPIPFEDGELL